MSSTPAGFRIGIEASMKANLEKLPWMDDATRAKAWLDVHGTDLHRYGLEADAFGKKAKRRPASRAAA